MNRDVDITKWIRIAIDRLFISNPKGTSVGILCGVVLKGALISFEPWFEQFKNTVIISRFDMVSCMFFGIVIFNIPNVIKIKRRKLEKSLEQYYQVIRKCARSGKLEDWQIAQMYIRLNNMAVEKFFENVIEKEIESNIQYNKSQTKNETLPS